MRRIFIFLSCLFLLAACVSKQPSSPSAMPLGESGDENPAAALPVSDTGEAEDEEMLALGMYIDYMDDVIGDGEPSVLFFHAAWCPVCKRVDGLLEQWYEEEDFPLTVYKVDYDSQPELRARYGVTYQHTFVLIDGEGKAVKTLTAPSDSDLRALLKTEF